MLSPSSWLAAAQALPEGHKARVDHDCGGGRTLSVRHDPDRWFAHCHRCSDTGIVDKQLSLSERIERRRKEQEADEQTSATTALPEPINTDVETWPNPAAVWLFKASIGVPEIAQLGAYHHDPTGRVVLPVVDGERVVYWQARDPTWTRKSSRPKYLNPEVNKDRLVAQFGSGRQIVLTEDILSAFRVGQVTEAWSLLGTHLSDPILSRIVAANKPVAVWLDPDKAGRSAARTISKSLAVCGVDARIIESSRDPKLLPRHAISRLTSLPQ